MRNLPAPIGASAPDEPMRVDNPPPDESDPATVAASLTDARRSNRQIAVHLGVHHKTVRPMLDNAPKGDAPASFRVIAGAETKRNNGTREERD